MQLSKWNFSKIYFVYLTINIWMLKRVKAIDTVSNLVFWSRFANKLEPWHNVYIF